MRRGRDGSASQPRYRRSGPTVAARPTFLIVTEGKKTEPNYFKALRFARQLFTAHIEFENTTRTDPISLTRYAIKRRDERAKKAHGGDGVEYDEVWVVFDLEEPASPRRAQAQQAKQLPRAGGIQFAVSDPCFEYFLLLHYESTTTAFSDCAGVTKRLMLSWTGYTKGGPLPDDLLARAPDAVGRAKSVRESHAATGGLNSPSTDVDLLLVELVPTIEPAQKS
jgi:hypothetical protein